MKSLNTKQLNDIYEKIELLLVDDFNFNHEEAFHEIQLIKNRLGLTGVIDKPDEYVNLNRHGVVNIRDLDREKKQEIIDSIKMIVIECLSQFEPTETEES